MHSQPIEVYGRAIFGFQGDMSGLLKSTQKENILLGTRIDLISLNKTFDVFFASSLYRRTSILNVKETQKRPHRMQNKQSS